MQSTFTRHLSIITGFSAFSFDGNIFQTEMTKSWTSTALVAGLTLRPRLGAHNRVLINYTNLTHCPIATNGNKMIMK